MDMEKNLLEMSLGERGKYYAICWLKGIPAGILTSLKMYGILCLIIEVLLWITKRSNSK